MSQQLSENLLRMLKLDSVTVSLLISKWKERRRHCKIQEMVSVVLFLKYVCCVCGDWYSCNIILSSKKRSPFVPNWSVSHSEHSDVSDRTWNTNICHIIMILWSGHEYHLQNVKALTCQRSWGSPQSFWWTPWSTQYIPCKSEILVFFVTNMQSSTT